MVIIWRISEYDIHIEWIRFLIVVCALLSWMYVITIYKAEKMFFRNILRNWWICIFVCLKKKNPIMLMTTMTTFTYVDVIQQCSFLHWYNLINHLLDCNGYRLLYYMTMMNRNCTNSLLRNSYSTMPVIRWLCALMLKEREIISQMGYPHILRDLALEQCKLNV